MFIGGIISQKLGLSFMKSFCLKRSTKNIFKVNNTVNDPFLFINITHMLQSLRCPVALFSPIYKKVTTASSIYNILVRHSNNDNNNCNNKTTFTLPVAAA